MLGIIIALGIISIIQATIIIYLWPRHRAHTAIGRALLKAEIPDEHFQLMADSMQDVLFRYDILPIPRLAYVSPAIEKVTGYTAEELLRDRSLWRKMATPDIYAKFVGMLFDPTQMKEPFEFCGHRKDGSVFRAEVLSTPIFSKAGILSSVIGFGRDITERHATFERLHKLSRAVEQSAVSITITDVDGVIEYVNPHFTQLSGFSSDEVVGLKPRMMRGQNAETPIVRNMLNQLRAGNEWRGELQNVTKTGIPYWEAGVVSPLLDTNGKVTHFVAVLEDITQRKQQERERAAVLAVSLALRAADGTESMLKVVQQEIATTFAAEKVFYITHDDVEELLVVQTVYVNGEFSAHVQQPIPSGTSIATHVYHTQQPYVTDAAHADPQFALPDLLGDADAICCVPLITQGTFFGLFAVAREVPFTPNDVRILSALADMTATGLQRSALHETTMRHAAQLERAVAEQTRELREANARLQELDQLKSKFVSDVSHEFRTPVTNITLYLSLFERKPSKQAQYLEILKREAARLEMLVAEVMDLVRLEGKPTLALSAIDLNSLLLSVIETHRPLAESRNLKLSFCACPDLPIITGDTFKLTQVATNLVANAINYTREGKVTVSTMQHDDQHISFIVKDTGEGINPQDLPHIFDRFYRGHRDTMTTVPGTGLGLSIVQEIVTMHKGSVQIDSELGHGTTVTVNLPISPRSTR